MHNASELRRPELLAATQKAGKHSFMPIRKPRTATSRQAKGQKGKKDQQQNPYGKGLKGVSPAHPQRIL